MGGWSIVFIPKYISPTKIQKTLLQKKNCLSKSLFTPKNQKIRIRIQIRLQKKKFRQIKIQNILQEHHFSRVKDKIQKQVSGRKPVRLILEAINLVMKTRKNRILILKIALSQKKKLFQPTISNKKCGNFSKFQAKIQKNKVGLNHKEILVIMCLRILKLSKMW